MFFIHTLSELTWVVLMTAVSAFALWRGGTPERVVAIANLLAWAASNLVEDRQQLFVPQWGILAVDLSFLGVLLWFALRSNRAWPMWAAAFQLLGVVTHGAMTADRSVGGWAYITASIIWSYLVLVSLGVGTWLHWRRRTA